MMCRRGCQPGNNLVVPVLPPPIEALNIAIQEPSTRTRGVCKYTVSTHPPVHYPLVAPGERPSATYYVEVSGGPVREILAQ